MLFRVEHIEDKGIYRNVNLKNLGYFSTIDKVNCAIEHFMQLPGFSDSPNGFIITEVNVSQKCNQYVYELVQSIHDIDFFYHYENIIGVYTSRRKAIEAQKRFRVLNRNTFQNCTLVKELYLNSICVDEMSVFWGEGFSTSIMRKEL